MMLINEIQEKLMMARKAKDSVTVTSLTTLFGEAQMIGKNDGNRLTTDAEVVALTKKFIDKIDETIALITDENKIAALIVEKNLLSQFVPKQMSIKEVEQEIQKILSTLSVVDKKAIGIVNKHMKEKFSGKYDGKLVNEILKELVP